MMKHEIIKYFRSKGWRERPADLSHKENTGIFSLYKTSILHDIETEFRVSFPGRMVYVHYYRAGKWVLYKERACRSINIIQGIIRF